jgi:oligoribonuclease NrnB/cAMP/cGMP phosphodiesterase (DHH superfamily)
MSSYHEKMHEKINAANTEEVFQFLVSSPEVDAALFDEEKCKRTIELISEEYSDDTLEKMLREVKNDAPEKPLIWKIIWRMAKKSCFGRRLINFQQVIALLNLY